MYYDTYSTGGDIFGSLISCFLCCIMPLAVLAGLGFLIYYLVKKNKQTPAQPIQNNTATTETTTDSNHHYKPLEDKTPDTDSKVDSTPAPKSTPDVSDSSSSSSDSSGDSGGSND